MDEKKYSLNDIFGYLREATQILQKPVTVVSESEVKTPMTLCEFIAMSMANELCSDISRMASEETIARKKDVVDALVANHYEEVTFPNYEHFGIIMTGGKRRTMRTKGIKQPY